MATEEKRAIEAACISLTTAFAVHLDQLRYQAVAELFTHDAVYNPRGEVFHGRKGVLSYLNARPADRRSKHIITNQFVEVIDECNARGECALTYYVHEGALADDQPAPLTGPVLVGDYFDEFVLTDKGWRIQTRIGRIAFDRSATKPIHETV